jgi:hypothetical protein
MWAARYCISEVLMVPLPHQARHLPPDPGPRDACPCNRRGMRGFQAGSQAFFRYRAHGRRV